MSQSEPDLLEIAADIKRLSLKDKTELRSLLDRLLLEERTKLLYENYLETALLLSRSGSEGGTDIAMLDATIEGG